MNKEIRNQIFNLSEGGSSGSSWAAQLPLINEGQELLTNGNLEFAGAGGADVYQRWSEIVSDGAIADENTIVHSIGHSLKITSGATTDTRIYRNITVEPSTQYVFGFYCKTPNSGRIKFQVWNISLSENLINNYELPNRGNAWYKEEILINVPAETSVIQVFIFGGLNTTINYIDDISLRKVVTSYQRDVKSPESTSWTEGVSLGEKQLSDVKLDGTILAVSPVDTTVGNRTIVFKSVDEGANWINIYYNPTGSVHFPDEVLSARIMNNGKLLACLADGTFYLSNSVAWNDGFHLVLTFETPNTNSGNSHFFNQYGDYVIVCEYYVTSSNYVYLSKNNGETWKKIFTIPLATEGNYHIHNACYDPYERKFWVVTGDVTNRGIYYSSDFGDTWVSLGDFGAVAQGMVQIMPLPECIAFGSDAYTPICWAIKRKVSGIYTFADMINMVDISFSNTGDPLCSRQAMIYGDDGCTYFGYYYDNDGVSEKVTHLFATRDGINYYDIANSLDVPVGLGNQLGITVVCKLTSAGVIYLSYNKGTAGRYLCKVQSPVWS